MALPSNYKQRTDGSLQMVIATTLENLGSIPTVAGQMIYCSANSAVYYDKSATERMKVIDELVYWKQQPPAWVQRTSERITVTAELNVRGASYYWEVSDDYKGDSTVWVNNANSNVIGFSSADDSPTANRVARCKAIYNGKTYYSSIVRYTSKNLASFGITDAYTKTETDAAITAAISAALTGSDTPIYSKDEVDALLEAKADTATTLEGYGITDAVAKDDFVFWEVQPASFVSIPSVGDGGFSLQAKLNVDGATYQWQYLLYTEKNPYSTSAPWADSETDGNKTDTILIYSGNSGYCRCIATYNGKTYISNIAKLVNGAISSYGITNVYTKTEVDGLIPDTSNLATKATTLAGYNIGDAYTKAEVDAAILAASIESSTMDETHTQLIQALADDKADKATTLAGYGITDAYTKGQVDSAISTAVTNGTKNLATKSTTLSGYGITNAYTKAEVDALIPEVPDVSGKADKATTLEGYGITDAVSKEDFIFWEVQPDTWVKKNTSSGSESITLTARLNVEGASYVWEICTSNDAYASNAIWEDEAKFGGVSGAHTSTVTIIGAYDYAFRRCKAVYNGKTYYSNISRCFSSTLAGYGITNAYTKAEVDALIPNVSGLAAKSTTLAGYGITDAYTKGEVNALIPDVSGLASKSTTLAGYGITNAYTKAEVDALIPTVPDVSNFATKATTLAGYGITDAYTKTQTDTAITNATKNLASKSTTLAGYGITNAYTKTEVDGLIPDVSNFATKATSLAGYGIADAYTKTEVGTQITNATKNLATKSTTLAGYGITNAYTKAEVDALIPTVPDVSNLASKSTTLAGYGITNAYTKTETDNAISTAVANALTGDDTPVYSKDEVDALIPDVSNFATKSTTLAGYGITNAYTKSEVDAKIPNISNLATKATTLAGYGIANAYTKAEVDALIPEVPDVSGFATKATTLAGYGITDAYTKTQTDTAITNATKNLAAKATTLAGYGIGDAYTKAQVDALIPDVSDKADKATTLEGYGITDAVAKDDFVFWEVQPAPILQQQENVNTSLRANLNVTGATYKWQRSNSFESNWEDSTETTNSDGTLITILGSAYYKYRRCVATYNGKTYYSNITRCTNESISSFNVTDIYTKTEVDGALSQKANKGTSLSAYGITDAYTKDEVDDAISDALSSQVKLGAEYNNVTKTLRLFIA